MSSVLRSIFLGFNSIVYTALVWYGVTEHNLTNWRGIASTESPS